MGDRDQCTVLGERGELLSTSSGGGLSGGLSIEIVRVKFAWGF
jgi:hypothetical protein